MVFMATYINQDREEEQVISKVFTLREVHNGIMDEEVGCNKILIESKYLVKMIEYKYPEEGMQDFIRNGEVIDAYGYMLLPYCRNGSLLDLLICA